MFAASGGAKWLSTIDTENAVLLIAAAIAKQLKAQTSEEPR